jgi:dolichol-phosphate mannosyltransferase
VKFTLVGASGYIVNLASFGVAMKLMGVHYLPAASAAFCLAVSSNLALNRRWTFDACSGSLGFQALRFFAVSTASFFLAAGLLAFLVAIGGVPALAAQGLSIVCVTPLNFLGNKLWTFQRARHSSVANGARLDDSIHHATGSIWLVLPTYNEIENLEPFVRSVMPQLARMSSEYHVLIVDDSSPDGTGQVADLLAAEFAPVHVLHRPRKEGIGPAYLAGFEQALAGGAEFVLQMDSDFSHDICDLPRLLSSAQDVGVALGSRYVAGGGVRDWGLSRRLVSRAGCWYARTVLRVPIRDLTGGFKCFRRSVLQQILLSEVTVRGYGFQIELSYRAVIAGFPMREVPIEFKNRKAGSSKMNCLIALEALWQIPALKLRTRKGLAARSLPPCYAEAQKGDRSSSQP